MPIGYTEPDPTIGERKEVGASWILSVGTAPLNLLERCLLFNSAEGSKRLNWNKIGLNLNTVPDELVGFEDDEPVENAK